MCKRLNIEATITDDKEEIKAASRLLLPGVGHFKRGMANLHETGMVDLLNQLVLQEMKPILGICLGAQLLTKHSEEGDVDGLGWVDAQTVRFDKEKLGKLPIPHMGWSDITTTREAPLWNDLPEEPRFYFVHEFHFDFTEQSQVTATAKYGYDFACAFQKDNIYGTQFHPEKSHKFGMKVLENFSKV